MSIGGHEYEMCALQGFKKLFGFNGVPGVLMPACKRAVSAKLDFFMRGVVLNTQLSGYICFHIELPN